MESYIEFENHRKYMEKYPIIFHKDYNCRWNIMKCINWHENIELIRVIEGEGKILCGEQTILAKENDVVILNCNILHSFSSTGHFVYDCLIIDRDYILKNGLDTNSIMFECLINNDEHLLKLIDNVKTAFSPNALMLDVNATVLPLISYLYHNYSCPELSINNRNNDAIKQAITYISNNLANDLSLDIISENIGISKYHFVRKFKKITGYTPVQYINIQRCELAKALLKEGKNIKEIIKHTGYDNQSYFSKVFLSVTGKTPSEYKQG